MKPTIYKEIGLVSLYYEKFPPEDERMHWLGECYLSNEHFSDELIKKIGEELLLRTSCKEPFKLNVCKGERISGKCIKFGEVYTPEFFN